MNVFIYKVFGLQEINTMALPPLHKAFIGNLFNGWEPSLELTYRTLKTQNLTAHNIYYYYTGSILHLVFFFLYIFRAVFILFLLDEGYKLAFAITTKIKCLHYLVELSRG